MSRTIALFTFIVLGSLIAAGPAQALTLWYNGDLNGQTALLNQRDFLQETERAVYYDFIVPEGEMWNVTELFSNNLLGAFNHADYEIRQGVSNGNGGTLIASGTLVFAFATPTGRSYAGLSELQLHVPVEFSLGSGTYWLMVRPVVDTGLPSITGTSGLNAVGAPPGNDGNAFYTSSTGSYFIPTTQMNTNALDFSMGIEGTSASAPVPEPSTMLLLGSGLVGLIGIRKKFRK